MIIRINTSSTSFKVTYSIKGDFKKIEIVKGKLENKQVYQLGAIIPPNVDHIPMFRANYPNIQYVEEVKAKSLYTLFVEEWNAFYFNLNGYAPKFTAVEGKCLKDIIKYLTTISGSEEEILSTWQVLLNSWNRLDEFHQKNTDLKYINGNLNRILDNVKRGSGNQPKYSDDFKRKLAERLQAK